MKFLISGATAFAGAWLAKLLVNEGHEVFATSRRTNGSEIDILDIMERSEFDAINWLFCDLQNKASCFDVMRSNKYDGIFHLAAQSHPPTSFELPFYTQDVNIKGTLNLLEGHAKYQPETRFLFSSTSEVYGAPDLKKGEAIDESYPIAPINPYAVSKASIDLFIQERIRNGYLNGVISRAFSHTGPRRGRIFSISSDAFQIASILMGKQKSIIKVGNLNSKRVVCDVRDVVRAYWALMKNPELNGVYNVGGEGVRRIGYFLDKMIELSGLTGNVKTKADDKLYRPVDIHIQIPNSSKLILATEWKPEISIERTLSDLLEYWKKKLT